MRTRSFLRGGGVSVAGWGWGGAGVGGERGGIDEEGAGGDVAGELAGFGDGEDDGTAEVELDGIAVAVLAVGEADAGGEAAERVRDGGGEVRDVIEGEDPGL